MPLVHSKLVVRKVHRLKGFRLADGLNDHENESLEIEPAEVDVGQGAVGDHFGELDHHLFVVFRVFLGKWVVTQVQPLQGIHVPSQVSAHAC